METKTNRIKLRRINALSFAKLVDLLIDGAYSLTELAEQTGLHPLTVGHYCGAMHKEGCVHICGWAPDSRGRYLIKVYKLGRGKDASRPPKVDQCTRQARYRQRKRAAQLLAATAGRGGFVAKPNGRLAFVTQPETEAAL